MAHAVLLLPAAALPAAARQPAPLAGLDAYIERALPAWEVPGLSIAVIRNDSVIHLRGFGVHELGGTDRVDEHTLFAIASATKAFTAAALGMLVDEKLLAWDDRATRWLPDFELVDPYVTRELTVRDLLAHRSGISRSDNIWIAAPFDRAEILRRARHLPTAGAFRADYGYHNVMYIAAGEAVAAAAGLSWDDFLEQRIFRPLGMARTTTRTAAAEARGNIASSHTRVDGRVTAVPRRDYDNIGGAGSIFSSAHDLARWIRLQLGVGELDGQRLIDAATMREMHAPQTILRADTTAERMFPGTHFRAYGLGWFLQNYHGHKLVHHSGSINYTRTQIGMIPELGIGVAVMANLSTSTLQLAVMYRVLDALMGLPPRDWSAEYLELARRGDVRSAEQARALDAARLTDTRPSLPVERYAGTFDNAVFGVARIAVDNGALVLHYSPEYVADLEHWHHDTFRALWRRPGAGRAFVSFTIDPRARVQRLELDGFGAFDRR